METEKLTRKLKEWEHMLGPDRFIAVSTKEGCLIGEISNIYLNQKTKQVTAFTFRATRLSEEYMTTIEHIKTIGQEIVFVDSLNSLKKVQDSKRPRGTSLRELLGRWVTTRSGMHLGKLLDVDIDSKTWLLSELRLSDNRVLPINVSEISIGKDEIVVPSSYADSVYVKENQSTPVSARLHEAGLLEKLAVGIKHRLSGDLQKSNQKGRRQTA